MVKNIIKSLIQRVNSTLRYYEKEYIELQRTPNLDREKCFSFEQFIEIRFNMECCRIPELCHIQELLGGHLFICRSLENPDELRRRFSLATVSLITVEEIENPNEELISELARVKEFLGGSVVKFNSVKQKIKYTIYE